MTDEPRGEARARTLRAKQKRDEVTRKTVIAQLMSYPEGRRFIWLEIVAARVFEMSYVEGSFDLTAFQEGKRSRGNQLLSEVTKWCPESYIKMTKENAEVEIKEDPDENSSEPTE